MTSLLSIGRPNWEPLVGEGQSARTQAMNFRKPELSPDNGCLFREKSAYKHKSICTLRPNYLGYTTFKQIVQNWVTILTQQTGYKLVCSSSCPMEWDRNPFKVEITLNHHFRELEVHIIW